MCDGIERLISDALIEEDHRYLFIGEEDETEENGTKEVPKAVQQDSKKNAQKKYGPSCHARRL